MIGVTWDKASALDALTQFGQIHGRAPTCAEFKRPSDYGIPHTRTVTRLFGGEVAAIMAAGLPPRKRNTQPPTRPSRRRDPDLRDLGHEWYRSDRVVAFVLKHYPRDGIYTHLCNRSEASGRRWTSAVNGEQQYLSLPVVDKILTHLDLHVWLLGDPDLISATAPGAGRLPNQLQLEEAA